MHELAICQALIDQVVDLARAKEASAVSEILLSIGPLSGAEPALLQNAFPIAAAGTIAASAILNIKSLPVKVHCAQCGRDSAVPTNNLSCPCCNNWRTSLVGGDELLLTQLVMEVPEADVGNASTPHSTPMEA